MHRRKILQEGVRIRGLDLVQGTKAVQEDKPPADLSVGKVNFDAVGAGADTKVARWVFLTPLSVHYCADNASRLFMSTALRIAIPCTITSLVFWCRTCVQVEL